MPGKLHPLSIGVADRLQRRGQHRRQHCELRARAVRPRMSPNVARSAR